MSNKSQIPLDKFKDVKYLFSYTNNDKGVYKKYCQIHNSLIKKTVYTELNSFQDSIKAEKLLTEYELSLDERIKLYDSKVIKLYLIRDSSLTKPLNRSDWVKYPDMHLFNNNFTKMTLKVRNDIVDMYHPKRQVSKLVFYDSKGRVSFIKA